MLRNTKFFRSFQFENPNRQTSATDTDILIDNAHQYAQTVLAPRIRQKSQNAVKTDRIQVNYYQQKKVGRLCSCYKKEYDSPETDCLVCFGVGRVGGYNIYGRYVDVVDTTYPNLTMLNIQIDDEVWPWKFKLTEGILEGYVDAIIDVPTLRDVDLIKLYSTGKYLQVFVRKYNDIAWHTLNRSSILSLSSSEKRLVVRIIMSRRTVDDSSPTFTHLYIRYKILDKSLYADMPKPGEFKNSDNFALTGLQTTQVFFPSDLPSASVNDIFKENRFNTMWRIVEVTKNAPLGVLTSWDAEIRSIESFEIYTQLP